jgi:hypothetical protein
MKIAVVAFATLLASSGVTFAQSTVRGTVGQSVPPHAATGSQAGNNANSLSGSNSAANNNTLSDSVEGRSGGGSGGGGSGGSGGAGAGGSGAGGGR